MIELAKKNLTLVITLGISLATVGYTFLVFLPAQREIKDQRQMLVDKQKAVVQSTQTQLVLDDTNAKLEMAREYVARWQAAAPQENSASQLFGTLTQFADQAGVEIVQFQPQPPENLETIGRVKIALGLRGEFSEIHELFRQLESLEETVWVENLVIEATQAGQGDATCEVTLVVFTGRSENSD